MTARRTNTIYFNGDSNILVETRQDKKFIFLPIYWQQTRQDEIDVIPIYWP
jgi:hypothetical protein